MKVDFGKKDSYLIVSSMKGYQSVVEALSSLNGKVLYISLNRPSSSMKVGKNYSLISSAPNDKCPHIDNLESLTTLSILITNMVEVRKYDFLVIDSVNTLLAYNDEYVTLRFLHFIVNKMKIMKIVPILIISDDRKGIINQIGQLVSKVVKA